MGAVALGLAAVGATAGGGSATHESPSQVAVGAGPDLGTEVRRVAVVRAGGRTPRVPVNGRVPPVGSHVHVRTEGEYERVDA